MLDSLLPVGVFKEGNLSLPGLYRNMKPPLLTKFLLFCFLLLYEIMNLL